MGCESRTLVAGSLDFMVGHRVRVGGFSLEAVFALVLVILIRAWIHFALQVYGKHRGHHGRIRKVLVISMKRSGVCIFR